LFESNETLASHAGDSSITSGSRVEASSKLCDSTITSDSKIGAVEEEENARGREGKSKARATLSDERKLEKLEGANEKEATAEITFTGTGTEEREDKAPKLELESTNGNPETGGGL
jgi:hypothetical protein